MKKNIINSKQLPLVSIGLPVYNGENYIESAIDSIICQTFPNFELIISDNASTDRTESICRAYASKNNRIRYVRNTKNKGAAWNFNRVFKLSSGKYFKWLSHDDICMPDFIEKCVSVLELDPTAVLCSPRVIDIDECGEAKREINFHMDTQSYRVYIRLYDLILKNHPCFDVFGLIRSKALKDTLLIGDYVSSDRVLLVELGIRGKFFEIPDFLFMHREHKQRSTKLFPAMHLRMEWFNPKKKNQVIFPKWRLLVEYYKAIKRSSLRFRQRSACSFFLFLYFIQNIKIMIKELFYAIKKIFRFSR